MSFSEEYGAHGSGDRPLVRKFRSLMRPVDDRRLEAMAQEARHLTFQHFGKTVRLFAPIYLSNECINICKYCGFSRENPILRVTLTEDQVEAEARYLAQEGFRSLLLVAGEHPKFVSGEYLQGCVSRLTPWVPAVSLEVGPLEEREYAPLVRAGAEGLVVYQETYQRELYASLHVAGPKKDFDWRLDCPERAALAGFRRVGIGALLGLGPWEEEVVALVAHADYLLRHCWRTFLTISLPRMRPAAGEFTVRHPVGDRDFVQLLCALRMTFPQVGLVVSTRESAHLRDHLVPLGVTHMSAGSATEPGGYTGAGRDRLHQTRGGVPVLPETRTEVAGAKATEQFHIADERSAVEVADRLREMGYDPVWKDWDAGILGPTGGGRP